MAHSTALHGRRTRRWHVSHRTPGTVGEQPRPRARRGRHARRRRTGCTTVERNPFRSIVIRGLEVLVTVIEAQEIVATYVEPGAASVDVVPTSGVGWGVTEAHVAFSSTATRPTRAARSSTPGSSRRLRRTNRRSRPTSDGWSKSTSNAMGPMRSCAPIRDPPSATADPCISCATPDRRPPTRGAVNTSGVGHRDRADDGIGPGRRRARPPDRSGGDHRARRPSSTPLACGRRRRDRRCACGRRIGRRARRTRPRAPDGEHRPVDPRAEHRRRHRTGPPAQSAEAVAGLRCDRPGLRLRPCRAPCTDVSTRWSPS